MGYNPYRKANGEFATKEEAGAQVENDYRTAFVSGDQDQINEIEEYVMDNMDNTPLGQQILGKRFGMTSVQHFKKSERSKENFSSKHEKKMFEEFLNIPKHIPEDWKNFDEKEYLNDSKTFLRELNENETSLIKNYVEDGYQDINEYLWSSDENSVNSAERVELDQKIAVLDEALRKTPLKDKIVWRTLGPDLSKKLRENPKNVGETIEFKGFTSTCATPSSLVDFSWTDTSWYMEEVPSTEWERNGFKVKVPESYSQGEPKNIVYEILTKKGAAVSSLRINLTEQEYLLPRGMKFRIVGKKATSMIKDKKNIRALVYQLEEINE